MTSTSHKITIIAPRDRVFQALTHAEEIRQWFTPHVEGSYSPEREMVFRFSNEEPFHWKQVEVSPGAVLRCECTRGPGNAVGTSLTYRLTNKGDGQTAVECDHEGFEETDGALKSCNTRWGILMGHLKQYVETGRPAPAFA